MPCKQGDVVLLPFPFTDLTTTKQRPALIVSPDAMHASSPDVIVAAITSQVPATLSSATEVLLSPAEQQAAGLLKTSVVKLDKLVTIDQRLVRKTLGHLSPATMARVLAMLQQLFAPSS